MGSSPLELVVTDGEMESEAEKDVIYYSHVLIIQKIKYYSFVEIMTRVGTCIL